MAETMKLGLDNHVGPGVTITDGVFAIHALAVIAIHDHEKNEDNHLSMAKIASEDSYLCYTKGTLRWGFLLTFGRNCIPLLRKLLIKEYNYVDDQIDQEVSSVTEKLYVKLLK